ncbi:Ig-like domain-containing protein [Microbacterium sp. LWH10-1.2]|uniref:Ig-like domain-containing protein n=1 Tax=Microbacterium sp. LWH10-1.2 TaxID=3135255 RepID=UPI003139B26F
MKISIRSRRKQYAGTTVGAVALASVALMIGTGPAAAVVVIPPPIPADDDYTMVQGSTLAVPAEDGVLINDDEGAPGAGPLQVTTLTNSNLLSQMNADGAFSFTPAPDFVGTYVWTYRVHAVNSQRDSDGAATVTITVTAAEPENAAPVAEDDTYEVSQGAEAPTRLTVGPAGILGNDSDPDGDPIVVCDWAADDPSMFEAVNADGSLVFAPGAAFTGVAELFYWVCDDHDHKSDVAKVTITVTPAVAPEPRPDTPQKPDTTAKGELAQTGAEALPGVVASALLLGAGAVLVALRSSRRRRAV